MTGWLIGAALAIAVVDWTALSLNNQKLESVAKPAVMVALILAAVTATGSPDSVRWFVVAGLAFGLAGDVFLLPRIDRFVTGLASFLVGHVLYVVGFILHGVDVAPGIAGLVVALALIAATGPPILRSVSGTSLAIPVALYVATITVMVAAAWATGSWWFAAGALIFALSDALLAHDRFVAPRVDRRVWVHVLYHVGQAAIVAGL